MVVTVKSDKMYKDLMEAIYKKINNNKVFILNFQNSTTSNLEEILGKNHGK